MAIHIITFLYSIATLIIIVNGSYRGCVGSCKNKQRTIDQMPDSFFKFGNKTFGMYLAEKEVNYKLGDPTEFHRPFTEKHFTPTSDSTEFIIEGILEDGACNIKTNTPQKFKYVVGTVLKLTIRCKLDEISIDSVKFIRVEAFEVRLKSQYKWSTSDFSVSPYHFPLYHINWEQRTCLNYTICTNDSYSNRHLYKTEKVPVENEAYQIGCEHGKWMDVKNLIEYRVYRYNPNPSIMTHVFQTAIEEVKVLLCVLDDETQTVECNYPDQLGFVDFVDSTNLFVGNIGVTVVNNKITDFYPLDDIQYRDNTISGLFGDIKFRGFTSSEPMKVFEGRVAVAKTPDFYRGVISVNAPRFWSWRWRCPTTYNRGGLLLQSLKMRNIPYNPVYWCYTHYEEKSGIPCPLNFKNATEYKSDTYDKCTNDLKGYFNCLNRYNLLIHQDPIMKFRTVTKGVYKPPRRLTSSPLVPGDMKISYSSWKIGDDAFFQPLYTGTVYTGSVTGQFIFRGEFNIGERMGSRDDVKSVEILDCVYNPSHLDSNCTVVVEVLKPTALQFKGTSGVTLDTTRVFAHGTSTKHIFFQKSDGNATTLAISVLFAGEEIYSITAPLDSKVPDTAFSEVPANVDIPTLKFVDTLDKESMIIYVVMGLIIIILVYNIHSQKRTYNQFDNSTKKNN